MSSGVRGLGWGEETRGQGKEEIGGERKSTWVGLFWGQGNSQLDAQARNQGIVLVSSLHPAPQSVPYHVQPVPPPAEVDLPFPLTTRLGSLLARVLSTSWFLFSIRLPEHAYSHLIVSFS